MLQDTLKKAPIKWLMLNSDEMLEVTRKVLMCPVSALPAPVFWIAQTQQDNNTSTVCITDSHTHTLTETHKFSGLTTLRWRGNGSIEWRTRALEVLCLVSRVCQPANGQTGHRLSLNGDPKPLATQTLQRVVMGDSVKPPWCTVCMCVWFINFCAGLFVHVGFRALIPWLPHGWCRHKLLKIKWPWVFHREASTSINWPIRYTVISYRFIDIHVNGGDLFEN